MNINFGPISFSLTYITFWGTIMMTVLFCAGANVLQSFLLNDGSIGWLILGLAICYFSGGLLFWFFTQKVTVFRNELTIRNPLWFKNYQFYGDEVVEYGIMQEESKGGKYDVWRFVLKDRDPVDIAPEFYADFEVAEQFLKDNKIKFAKKRPFNEELQKRRNFAKKMEEAQMIGLIILFFALMSWWLSVVFQ